MKNSKKFIAGILSICMTISALSITSTAMSISAEDTAIIFSDGFETEITDWTGRGTETVAVSSDVSHTGTKSLYISDRTKVWHGATVSRSELKSGNSYVFSAWVMFNGNEYGGSQKFSMNLQYTQNGVIKYEEVGNATANKGNWTEITGEYTLPSDAEDISLYFQTAYVSNPTANDLMSFYLDDVSVSPKEDPPIQTDITPLKDAYKGWFKLGGAAMASELYSKSGQDLFKMHYNSLTFGNELKPDSTLDYDSTVAYMKETGDQTNPQVSIDAARSLLNFARDNNIPVRGHVLVWHSQTPDWFFKENYDKDGAWVSKEVMIERLDNYIKNIMETLQKEYPTVDFYAWDVVNEVFSETGKMREPGSNNTVQGQSAWVQVFGDDSFIDYAFQSARKYAPAGCKLFYNDYNEYNNAKRDAIYTKCKQLYEDGILDGIGMQSHLDLYYPSASVYEAALKKFAEIGCEIQVTELDITTSDTTETGIKKQAEQYKAIMDTIISQKQAGANVTAVVLWGITDATSWRANRCPLLFDKNFQAKPAYYSIIENIPEPPVIKYEVGDVNKDGKVNVADLTMICKYIVGIITDGISLDTSDINSDGVINVLDVVKLARTFVE